MMSSSPYKKLLPKDLFLAYRLMMLPSAKLQFLSLNLTFRNQFPAMATSYLPLSDNAKLQHVHGVSGEKVKMWKFINNSMIYNP